jgi:hypothetical protein
MSKKHTKSKIPTNRYCTLKKIAVILQRFLEAHIKSATLSDI